VIEMARSTKASQRRKVLAELRSVQRQLRDLLRLWDVTTTVYVSPPDRPEGSNAWLRDREEHEYPESRAEAWAVLYNLSDEMIKQLTALRETARTRYFEIKEGDHR
jgi:hypothetical protein